MRELTAQEIQAVSGGSEDRNKNTGNVVMSGASSWAGAVAGFGTGLIIGGPIVGLAGSAVGLAISWGTSFAYTLTQR